MNKNTKSTKTKIVKAKKAAIKPSLVKSWFKKPAFALTVIGVGLLGVGTIVYSSAATSIAKVADHPQAILQSTAEGKVLRTLESFNGRLYAGFGDYSANTGPVALTPFNGTSFGASPEILADTEAIYQFRKINGKLYAVSTDPKVGDDLTIGSFDGSSVSWAKSRPVGSTHAYDVFTLTGTDLWIVGSQSINAVAWRSLDGGANWSQSLQLGPVSGTANDFARFYGAITLNGKLYVQGRDYYGNMHPSSKVFDGNSWSDGPAIGSFTNSNQFAGSSIYFGSIQVGFNAAYLKSFNGSASSIVSPAPILNYTIDGLNLFALTSDGSVIKTSNLVNWTTIGSGATMAKSIAVLGGEVYLGGIDGAIYKMTITDAPTPVPPTNPTPTPPPADTTAPKVVISSPTAGATITGTASIAGSASDNTGIKSVDIYIDGKLTKTYSGVSVYSYRWNTRKVLAGQHTIVVKASDIANNVSEASVTVVK